MDPFLPLVNVPKHLAWRQHYLTCESYVPLVSTHVAMHELATAEVFRLSSMCQDAGPNLDAKSQQHGVYRKQPTVAHQATLWTHVSSARNFDVNVPVRWTFCAKGFESLGGKYSPFGHHIMMCMII